MARSFKPQALACALFIVVAMMNLALASAESATFKRCQAAYNARGGDRALMSLAPACAGDRTKSNWLNDCCKEAKTALTTGPFSKCLCDNDVYKYVEGRVSSAGIPGLTPTTTVTFLRACGIPSAKTGGC